jgi:hypothetical protein
MNSKITKFDRGDLFKLFLIVAFPLHVWTIFMALRDVGWVAEGRTVNGAIGFSAYVLVFTLVESLALFVFVLLLGLLISKKWNKDQRLASLGLVAVILASWSIIEQIILVLLFDRITNALASFTFLAASPWIGFAILAVVVAVSFALPVFLALRSLKITKGLLAVFDRISLLSGFYLVFDALAIVTLIVRNV